MKNLISFSVFLLIAVFHFVSCESVDIQIDTSTLNDKFKQSSIHVVYEGKDYYSQISYCEDSLIIEDSSLALLIDDLYSNNAEVQTLLHTDGALEYFDNKEIFKSKYPFYEKEEELIDSVVTKSLNYYDQFDGYAQMWIDPNYSGLMVDAVNIKGRIPQEYNLDSNCNNKISSIKVFLNSFEFSLKSKLECYENNSQQGACYTIYASLYAWPTEIQNLQTVPCGNNGNWNDRISSIRFSVISGPINKLP